MAKFDTFCPGCGHKLILVQPIGGSRSRWICEQDGCSCICNQVIEATDRLEKARNPALNMPQSIGRPGWRLFNAR